MRNFLEMRAAAALCSESHARRGVCHLRAGSQQTNRASLDFGSHGKSGNGREFGDLAEFVGCKPAVGLGQ